MSGQMLRMHPQIRPCLPKKSGPVSSLPGFADVLKLEIRVQPIHAIVGRLHNSNSPAVVLKPILGQDRLSALSRMPE